MPPAGRRAVIETGGGAAMPTITQLAIIMLFVLAWVLVVMIASGFTTRIFGNFGQGAAGFGRHCQCRRSRPLASTWGLAILPSSLERGHAVAAHR